ncbi:MAG: type transport system permease protein [Solirubrobacteraceae bacterium]|nr:type transport system permease protein [Solirubrobacteraceae bacterium]MEA2392831.1 type transport system permease protein [Solirubrobacteraceae bacterium]
MTRDLVSVSGAVLRRNLTHAFKNPALLIPSIVFPLVFLLAFAGGLSNVGDVPGFDFPSGYTAFQFVFVFLQAAAFGGVFTGLAIAGDFESGFARRLLLGAPRRMGIIAGYVLAAMARFAVTGAVVSVAALLAGMRVDGGAAQLLGLLSLALLLNVTATLWATGMAMRFQSLQAAPAMQIPVFLILFLAPVYVPLDLLSGWISHAAAYNPATALLEAGRGFLSGRPTQVGLAYLAGFGLVAVGFAWAVTGLRQAQRGE